MFHTVEFIGGPLDGHTQPLPHSPELLSEILDVPVSADLLWILNGDNERSLGLPTSTAVYELERDAGRFLYRHAGSLAAEQHQLDGA